MRKSPDTGQTARSINRPNVHPTQAADHCIGGLGDFDVAGLLRFVQVYAMAVTLPAEPAHCPGAQVAIAVAGHPVLPDF